VTMDLIAVLGVLTGTTTLVTPTGTLGFVPLVTTAKCSFVMLRRYKQAKCGQLYRSCFGEYRRSGEWGVAKAKPRPAQTMGKKHKNLINKIHDMDNIWEAYRKASLGKRASYGYLKFRENDAASLVELSEQIKNGTYTQTRAKTFVIYEPKKREITAVNFVDRVAHHALVNIIGPIFERCFLPYSYACREGMGTHAAVKRAQSLLRKHEWFLKIDFKAFFPSVRRDILFKEIEKKITCQKTLDFIKKIHPETGCGIPIGSLTSQLFANLYGHIFDRFLTHELKISAWVRYMDDIIIFADSKEILQMVFARSKWFVFDRMGLGISRWAIRHFSQGLSFLGYRVWREKKRVKRDSFIRAKRRLKKLTGICREKFVAAWGGHVKFADGQVSFLEKTNP